MKVGYDLKWNRHVDRMVGKADRMLANMDPGLWKDLYVSLLTKTTLRVCCASMESLFARRH